MTMYRGFRITYDPPPIPVRDMDWHYVHDDFDGAPDGNDHRYGHCASEAECRREIDEYYEALEDEEQQQAQAEHEFQMDRKLGIS